MSSADDFRCLVCDTVGQWESVDKFRLKNSDMHMCRVCGFVSYPLKYKSEAEIKEYYRKEYRGLPQIGNLYSGERKLHYHNFFLKPLFEEWKKHAITKPVIGEIGSAIGMFLHWVKAQVPGAEVFGTELTTSYRKVAFYEFGVKLEEEFDYTKKYDLICSYHVLEHQNDADKYLEKYADCLKDNGVFYLSCPIWFRDLNNSAVGGFDIEYYWHPDHINAWSEQHLEWVIAKSGLEIVYKNTEVYGNTYILKKGLKQFDAPKWNTRDNAEFLDKAFKVWQLIQENKPMRAIELHKNCPAAWINHYELNRANFHKNKDELMRFLDDACDACPNSGDVLVFAGDVMSRYEEWDKALNYFNKALKKKPNSPTIVLGIAHAYRSQALKEKDTVKRTELIKKSLDATQFVRETSLELKDKATSWIYHDFNMLALPGGINEKASNDVVVAHV